MTAREFVLHAIVLLFGVAIGITFVTLIAVNHWGSGWLLVVYAGIFAYGWFTDDVVSLFMRQRD